jgi:hypothetical protein
MNVTRPALALALLGVALCSGATCSVSCDAAFAFAAGGDRETEMERMLFTEGGAFLLGGISDEGVQPQIGPHDGPYSCSRSITVPHSGHRPLTLPVRS